MKLFDFYIQKNIHIGGLIVYISQKVLFSAYEQFDLFSPVLLTIVLMLDGSSEYVSLRKRH